MAEHVTGVSKFEALATIFAAAFGFSLLFLMGTSAFVNSLFHDGSQPSHTEQATAESPVAEPVTPAPTQPGSTAESSAAPASPAASAPIGTLLAVANTANGEKASKKCVACHTFDKGGKAKVGPNLYNIVGRPIGAAEGFAYSPAMLAYAGANKTWSFDRLAAFLRKPGAVVPKNKMGFAGIASDRELADMILYLRSMADTPVPLPGS